MKQKQRTIFNVNVFNRSALNRIDVPKLKWNFKSIYNIYGFIGRNSQRNLIDIHLIMIAIFNRLFLLIERNNQFEMILNTQKIAHAQSCVCVRLSERYKCDDKNSLKYNFQGLL